MKVEIELSKEVRRQIYQDAKKEYEKDSPFAGMCYFLNEELYIFCSPEQVEFFRRAAAYEYLLDIFPELAKQKPVDAEVNSYWWDRRDKEVRIKAFDEMIKLTY